MEYKGIVTFDEDANIFHGEVIDIKDVITFQADSLANVEQAFKDSVNDYLAWCNEPKTSISFDKL